MGGDISGLFSVFGGALVGAAISGCINIWLHFRTLDKAATQRANDRKDTRKAQAFSLLVKLSRILSDGTVITREIDLMIARAKEAGHEPKHLSMVVMPMSPSPFPVTFTSDELALVLSLDDDLFNQIAALDQLHASTAAMNTLYGQKRETLMTRFGAKMEGNVGTTILDAKEKQWFEPRLIEVEDILAGVRQFAAECRDEGGTAIKRWHAVMRKEFDLKQSLIIKEERPPSSEQSAGSAGEKQPNG